MARPAFKTAWIRSAAFLLACLFCISLVVPARVSADVLSPRSIRISNTTAAQNNVTYRVGFSTVTTHVIGSIAVEFCSNTALVDDGCVAPIGMNVTGAALSSQSGITGFSLSANTTANRIVLSRPPQLQLPTAAVYTFTGIVNPFTGGSYYARIYTYPTSNGTFGYSEAGGLALSYRPAFGVNAVVPPYLRFCLGESISGVDCTTATEPSSDLGILSPLVTGVAQTQMVVATNADSGYSMWVIGGTMTSGSNIIPAMAAPAPSQRGTGQFGINLRANTAPVIGEDPSGPGVGTVDPAYFQQNQYKYQSGDTLATAIDPDDNRKYTVSYIVNVPAGQPGGIYATTLTYVVLANF